ncbi:hypothetical protein H4219_001307 [Mycoemilia scoparia]|uniref:Uncharacterized protein n=1 Tax=Mycoemilia scoparia TaxID=417184 RepID=A0A9W8A8J9_9FUNG|nr:hypothetical protein H4219_001307 [Mycoemilia scoparia]
MVLKLKEVYQGAALVTGSTIRLLKEPSIRAPILKTMTQTLGLVYVLYLAGLAFVYIPMYILSTASNTVTMILGYESSPLIELGEKFGLPSTPYEVLGHLVETVPFLAVDLVLHLTPKVMDETFFVSLKIADPIYAQVLQAHPRRHHLFSEIVYSVKRSCKRWFMAVSVMSLGGIPLVGQLALPIANVYVLSKYVGYPVAGGIAVASLIFPSFRGWAMFTFKTVMALGTFSRDLFKPYFRRVAMKPKDQIRWYKQHESELVGFLLPLYLLTEMPWVGAMFFVLAQSVAAIYIAQKTKLENILLKQKGS